MIKIGDEFERWTVVSSDLVRRGYWVCQCICGKQRSIPKYRLLSGNSRSCGCLRGEALGNRSRKHGLSSIPEFIVWSAMKSRCYRVEDKEYVNYGGRGIKVCDEWLASFDNFIRDMGHKSDPSLSLDRIDNNKDYCLENCRWATRSQQNFNKRTTVKIPHKDKMITMENLVTISGLNYNTIRGRLHRGWSVDKIINTPVKSKRGHIEKS